MIQPVIRLLLLLIILFSVSAVADHARAAEGDNDKDHERVMLMERLKKLENEMGRLRTQVSLMTTSIAAVNAAQTEQNGELLDLRAKFMEIIAAQYSIPEETARSMTKRNPAVSFSGYCIVIKDACPDGFSFLGKLADSVIYDKTNNDNSEHFVCCVK